MANKLVVVMSGRKQSGKNSTANYIQSRFLNEQMERQGNLWRFSIDEKGELIKTYNNELTTFKADDGQKPYPISYGAKFYSFADPLKQFCINVFGATYEQMYGTDAQKNSIIEHLLWENLADEMRPIIKTIPHNHNKHGWGTDPSNPFQMFNERKSGPMTGRDIMQIFGTEMVRRLYTDAWARATYSAIKNDGHELALVTDGRFPNEIDMGNSVNAKTVRLLRAVYTEDTHASETALDNYPLENFTVVVDNRAMTLEEQCKFLDPYIDAWFKEAGFQ